MDAYIDGACRNNQEEDKGKVSSAVGVYIPEMNIKFGAVTSSRTNNEAEYDALIEALKIARKKGIKEIGIFSDSNLIVNHVNGRINDLPGRWRINKRRARAWAFGVPSLCTRQLKSTAKC